MNLKHELQSIISGAGSHSTEDFIQAAAHYLRESQKTGGNTEEPEFTKEQEAKKLIEWIEHQNLWFKEHDENRFFAKVYQKTSTLLFHHLCNLLLRTKLENNKKQKLDQ